MLKDFRAIRGIVLLVLLMLTGCTSHSATDRAGPQTEIVTEPLVVTDSNFQAVVRDCKQPVLIDFWTARCPPCLEMKPAIRELATDFAGRATIAQLDVDANPLIPERFNVREFPAVLIFQNGQVIGRLDGLRTKEELKELLNAAIES